MNKAICRELQKLESIKKSISTAQNKSSEMLYCRKIRGYYQYYVGKEYVSKKKNEKRIQMLALKEYREKLNPLLEKAIRHLKEALNSLEHLNEAYTHMHEGKQVLFEPDVVPVEKRIRDFRNVTYERMGFAENDKTETIRIGGSGCGRSRRKSLRMSWTGMESPIITRCRCYFALMGR